MLLCLALGNRSNKCRALLFKRKRYCLQDYFLFNLNERQEKAQKQINNDCFDDENDDNDAKENFMLLAAVWSFHYEGPSKANFDKNKKKQCRQDLRLFGLPWICLRWKCAKEKVCVFHRRAACDLNEWHLFIPCHWLISHCFCFIIKISRAPFISVINFASFICRTRALHPHLSRCDVYVCQNRIICSDTLC